MNKEIEFAIGEEIRIGDVVAAMCVESSDAEDCCDCCFFQLCEETMSSALKTIGGYCSREYRTDGKDIIFKLKV